MVSSADLRRNEILELLAIHKKCTVNDLVVRFGVSRRTISSDIVYLSQHYNVVSKPGPHGEIESIQRILQNEKYCGDVLLQKTFTEDVLTGVHKKNTGQLPQYYIENYHEGIVSKQMFREVQAEIARRNSKSAANQRKRRRGRYNSKYALSERLFCGDCGSPYKRVTWNIHGRKQIVWRCVNRIEYGTKFCGNSPSIPEEELHRAILKAIQGLAAIETRFIGGYKQTMQLT